MNEETTIQIKKIVFPERGERVYRAVSQLIASSVCHPVLIGDSAEISAEIDADPSTYTVLPLDDSAFKALQIATQKQGKEFRLTNPSLLQGAALVRDGKADGIVGGAATPTDQVFISYVKTIGVKEGVSRVTSCFLMERNQERYIFADCGLNPLSDAQQLAETAYLSAEFAKTAGIEPKVAFLSFQTIGNATHPVAQVQHDAVAVARGTYGLDCDGPLQFDAAFMPEIAARKAEDSTVAGEANVYIFPDLNSGNIAYKIAERMGGYTATGPLFLGFAKPAHDLSRGCNEEDIVRVAKMAVQQAQ